MDKEIKEKIHLLLISDAINYLETSERLVVKNAIDKKILSKTDDESLVEILEKYKKFIKN